MAGNRTLKLSILADVDNLKKNLDSSANDVQTFGDKIGKFGKIAGAAFAAAGIAAVAYAGKLAIDGVKAAIDDEAAQVRLATSLKNVTGATEAQIKATENYILKASLATGISDDQLRPSLDRLVRSTKNVEDAQKLQTLAINIAAGTGKNLQAVSEALAKAHDGNFTALKKLGGGIDENIIKSKDFDAATAALSKTFEGQATKQADTFAGKMDRLKVAFDEGKETVGVFILNAVTPLVTFIVDKIVPTVSRFIDSIGGDEGLNNTFSVFIDGVKSFVLPILSSLKGVFDKIKEIVVENKDEFAALVTFLSKVVAPFLGGAFSIAIKVLGVALTGILTIVSKIIDGFLAIINLGKKIGDALGGLFGGNSSNSSNASFGASIPSSIVSNASKNKGGSPINITVNGAIDPIGTARTIVNLLNQEATLSGTFNRVGSSKLQSV
jgi:hypothetical protein